MIMGSKEKLVEQDTEQLEFDFRNVPPSYLLCFNERCPRHGECLRYMAGQHLPDGRDFGPVIYPTVTIGDDGCRHFRTEEPKLMAWGFDTLFEEVKRKHVKALHMSMYQYLGAKSNYYRYQHGELLLSPEQQEWILKLFRRYHYSDNLVFDHYVRVYDFSH